MPIKATFTGDISDLRRSTQGARDEFRKVGTDAEGAARQLKAVGSSFDGSRLEGQARRVASGIERIGGASRLTDSELARNSRTISEVLQKYQRMGVEAPAHIRRLSSELQQAQANAKQLAATTDGIGARLSRGGGALLGGLGLGLGAGAGLGAITAIGAAISDIAADGARMAPLQQSFEKLQGGAVAANRELQRLRGETRGLVSDTDLMRQSNQASQLQLTKMGVDMGKLAGAAVTLGRAVGNDATASIDDLIGALGRGSTEVLDNLGITLKVAEAQEIYADRIHKTVAELTDQEKKQAFVTIGLERALEAAARLGEQQLTVMEQATRITTALGDMGAGMVSAGNQSVTLAGQLGGVADALDRIRNAQPGEVGDLIAGMLSRAGEEAQAAAEQAERNAPWYLRALAATGTAPLRLAGMAAQAGAPFIGDTNTEFTGRRTRDITLPTMPGAAGAIGSAGAVADLNAAREALGKLTVAQRDAIKAAKELGASNKEAAKAAGTTENVVKLFTASEAGAKKATTAVNKLREEFEKLTGQQAQQDATLLADAIIAFSEAGGTVPSDRVEAVANQLMAARKAAFEAGEETVKFRKALDSLQIPSTRIAGIENLLNINTIGFQSRDAIRQSQETRGSFRDLTGGILPTTNPLADTLVGFPGQISPNIRTATLATRDWRLEVRGVAQAFAQLAQIAGPSMNNVARGIGTTVASLDAAGQLVDSLAEAFPRLGLTERDAQGNIVMSGRGRAFSSALASATTGATLGSMTSNPFLGGALGAAGGLGTGLALGASGPTLGLSVAVGAASAIYTAYQNRRAQRAAMEQQRQSLIASMGGVEQFRESVERAGFQYDYFLSLFNSSDPDEFTDAVNRLNGALQEQEQQASALSKGLQEVARVQGVISQQQWAQIRNIDPDGPGAEEVLAFAEQQRAQAEQGVARSIAAINTATAGGTQNMDRYKASIGGVTASLVVLFDAAIRNGESALSVLQRLAEPIRTLQSILAASGQSGGEGFGQLAVDTEIATGEQTGPLVELASGLGSALAGMANSGLLSPELFGDIANGIGEAYHQLELLGKGGLEAARLMQPGLQAIWQMTQDTPALRDELDDTTLALLDFAEQNGLVGEGFRPAIDRMIDAIGDLIDKLDDLVDAINDVPGVTVPVTYVPGEFPETPTAPGGGGDSGSAGDGTYGGGADGDPSTPFALGGIVTRPTRALIGEAGPEAVISLAEYRALLQRQLQSQVGPTRQYVGASANAWPSTPTRPYIGDNHDEDSSRIIGRIGPIVEATTTRLLSTLDTAATRLEAWAGRIAEPAAIGGVTKPLPTITPDEPATRQVPPGSPLERDDLFGLDAWRGPEIADTGGRWTGQPGLRERLAEVDAGIHRPLSLGGSDTMVPLSRSGGASAPIQITVVSQIDGYAAARAITRHQPDVYRTYGAA